MADVNERQDFFMGIANKDDDEELLDELDALEAELVGEDFDQLEVESGVINVPQNQQQVPVYNKPAAAKQEDDVEQLRAMMGMS